MALGYRAEPEPRQSWRGGMPVARASPRVSLPRLGYRAEPEPPVMARWDACRPGVAAREPARSATRGRPAPAPYSDRRNFNNAAFTSAGRSC